MKKEGEETGGTSRRGEASMGKKKKKDLRGRLFLRKTIVMKDRRTKRSKAKEKKRLEEEIAHATEKI